MTERVAVAFIPVIHRGYLRFLEEAQIRKVYLLTASDVPELPHLAREVRALDPAEVSLILNLFGIESHLFKDFKAVLPGANVDLYMPDEDITRAVHEYYFADNEVTFLPTFLRWDWAQSTGHGPVLPEADRVVKRGDREADKVLQYMQQLFQERTKSSDWWRQVAGMAVTQEGKVLVAYNQHFPNEYVPYIDGDPRSNFNAGEHIEVSTALHAERGIIAQAANRGIALKGADLYVTTFPCSDCAAHIVVAGFSRVFFTGGYSNLNGVKTLRDQGVELVYIET